MEKKIDLRDVNLDMALIRMNMPYDHSLVGLMQDYSPNKKQELGEKLKILGIIKNSDKFQGIIVDTPGVSLSSKDYPWVRSGGESYLFVPRLQSTDPSRGLKEKKIAVKAIVTMFPHLKIEDMIKRYKILQDEGINVAQIYAVSKGCLIQDFIPYEAEVLFKPENKSSTLLKKIAKVAAKLDRRGFTTLHFIHDMRTDLKDVFYSDFGFDLGHPGNKPTDAAFKKLMECIDKHPPLRDIKEDIRQRYLIEYKGF